MQWLYFVSIGRLPIGIALLIEYIAPILIALWAWSVFKEAPAGRNTAIIRSNYRTPEGVALLRRERQALREPRAELDFNVMFSQHGHLTLAHTDRGVDHAARAGRGQPAARRSTAALVGPRGDRRSSCPELDLERRPTWPILAAPLPPARRHHPPRRRRLGLRPRRRSPRHRDPSLHRSDRDSSAANGRVDAASQTQPRHRSPRHRRQRHRRLVDASSPTWPGVQLPIVTHILQALVTEPLKPFLHTSSSRRRCTSTSHQTDRGEIVIGAEIEPYTTYQRHEHASPSSSTRRATLLELFPQLESAARPPPVDGALRHHAPTSARSSA